MPKLQDEEHDICSILKMEEKGTSIEHSIELYRMYCESTEKVSDRRLAANNVYISICSAIVAAITLGGSRLSGIDLYVLCAGGVITCVMWRRAIISFKQLNSVKFKLIIEIEKTLPLSIYTAEWRLLTNSRNQRYRTFNSIEKWVPFVFTAVFIGLLLNDPPLRGAIEEHFDGISRRR